MEIPWKINSGNRYEKIHKAPGWALVENLRHFSAKLLDVILPRYCSSCGNYIGNEEPRFWCGDCWRNVIKWSSEPLCLVCGIPFGRAYKTACTEEYLCERCLKDAYAFDRARSASLYDGVVSDLIVRLKYNGRLALIAPLSEILVEGYRRFFFSKTSLDLIVPVPLHEQKLKERGFNQALIMAKFLGKVFQLPINFTALLKARETPPQVSLHRNKRLENLRNAFVVSPEKISEVKGKRILLVDDVITTAATIDECAKALKQAGSLEVNALSVARAL